MEPEPEIPSVHRRAEGDLQFIRAVMQRSILWLPLPGWGIALVGVLGLLTAGLTHFLRETAWVLAWGVAAVLSLALTLGTSGWQLRHSGRSLLRGGFGKFWLGLLPAFGVAALLTLALIQVQQYALLPGTWLMLYGLGVLHASRHTVPLVRWMGGAFLLLGAPALFASWPNGFMGLGFGGIHLIFGLLIASSDYE